jgi:hypothetical protein
MPKLIHTVPKALGPALIDFCRTISIDEPIFVPSAPPRWAKLSFCFDNVARKVAKHGGKAAYGWAIWHVPGVYFEAEHHCVWQDKNGNLIDVSPQLNRAPLILFLTVPEAVYDPEAQRATFLQAESNDPETIEFVDLANERNVLLTRHHIDRQETVILDVSDQARFDQIMQRLDDLSAMLL